MSGRGKSFFGLMPVMIFLLSIVYVNGLFADDAQIESFIKRLYTNIYEREADQGGLEFWKNQLKSGESATEVAKFFYKSDEMKKLALSDEEFLKRSYKTFFDREPDKGGYEYWLDQMKNKGKRRDQIFYGFALSPEFKSICDSYGVVAFTQEDKRRAYIERFYNLIMQRDADEEGVKYWLGELERGSKTPADIAKSFFFAPEFINKRLGDKDFVTIAYRTLLNREPDREGLNYWTKELGKGVSREKILDMFLDSNEFRDITDRFLEVSQTDSSANTTPKAPSNFRISDLTTDSVTLRWDDNSNNEKGFKIYREEGKDRALKLIATLSPDTVSYKDIGLKSNALYKYRIRAFNDMGTSPAVDVSAVTLAKAPYDVNIRSNGCYEINIKWKAHSIYDEFNIYRDGKLVGSEGRGAIYHSYWDSLYGKVDDPCKKTFRYTIKAVNSAGVENSTEGGVVVASVTAYPAPPPSPPPTPSSGGNVITSVSGTVIDDPIANLPYVCGDGSTGKTDGGGNFECPKAPVTFKVGDLVVGNINKTGKGLILDLRDLAGDSDVNSPKVVNLAVFFQSLDDTQNDRVIVIPDNLNIPAQNAPVTDLHPDTLNNIIRDLGKNPVDRDTAKDKFVENINDNTPPNPPTVTGNPAVTNQNSVTVTVRGENNATVYINGKFVGTINNGEFQANLDLSGGDGIKRFSFALKDPAGNESDPLVIAITKDTAPPNAPIVQGDVPAFTNQDSVAISINGESGSEVFVNGVSKGTIVNGLKEINLDTSGDDGAKSFDIFLKDAAGNKSSVLHIVIKKDAAPPAKPTINSIFVQNESDDNLTIRIGEYTRDTVDGSDVFKIPVVLQGESGSKIFINGEYIGDVPDNGYKQLNLLMDSNLNEKIFNLILKDSAGNESVPLKIVITEDGTLPAKLNVSVVINGSEVDTSRPFATQQDTLNIEIHGDPNSKLFVNNEFNGTLDGSGVLNLTLKGYGLDPNKPENTFVFYLEDNIGNKGLDKIFKVVLDNSAPVFTTPSSAEIYENNVNALSIISTDPGGTQRYTIVGGADSDKFTVQNPTVLYQNNFPYAVKADLVFNNPPDYENPSDANGDNVYEVIVNAKDNAGNEANQTITITVKNFQANRVVLKGDVNNARNFVRFNKKHSKVLASDIYSFIVVDSYSYIKYTGRVGVDGSFRAETDTRNPVACIFLDENNKSLGYITLGDQIDSIPVMMAETDEIDFSQIDISNESMVPSNNPLDNNAIPLNSQEKQIIACNNTFFSAMIRNTDMDNSGKMDILEGRYFRVWPNYFIHAGTIDVNTKAVNYYTDDSQFFNGYKIFFATKDEMEDDNCSTKSISITGPDGTFFDDEDNDPDTIGDSGCNYITQSQSYTYYSDMVQDSYYPLAGDYNISYGNENLSFSLSDQSDFGNNVILIVPKVNVDANNKIISVNWEYKNRQDENLTSFAQQLINFIYVKINCGNNGYYHSDSIVPTVFSDSNMSSYNITFSRGCFVDFAYTTKYNTMYDISWEVQ